MKRKYKIIICAIIIIFLLVGLLSCFPMSVHYQETVSVCNLEGETIQVDFNVTLHKYLWRTDEMRGTIIVEDVEYVSARDLYSRNYFVDTFLFHVPTGNAIDDLNNSIILDLFEDNFDSFLFLIRKSGDEFKNYYGPAASLDEVEKILAEYSTYSE